jgi:hypothetical protein
MKKMLITLAVLTLVVPAIATVTVSVADEGSGVAAINYSASDANDRPRAFALDITLDVDNTSAIAPYDFHPEIYVSPGTFDYNETSEQVDSWGNPVVYADTNSLTIEMGSLWDPCDPCHPNPPALSGTLFRFLCDGAGAQTCVSLAENAARAGTDSNGVVLEDLEQVAVINLVDGCITLAAPCFPASCGTVWDDWDALGQPDCWCNSASGGTGDYQCDGYVELATETVFNYRVYVDDYLELVANWKKKITDPTLNPCADVDHLSETVFKYRVYVDDYLDLTGNWKAKDTDLGGDCGTAGRCTN